MAKNTKFYRKHPFKRLLTILQIEKDDIGAIYVYALLGGVLSLTVPLGIQSILNFAMSGAISTSLIVLILLVVLGVFLTGLLQINQLKLIEKIQQRVFVIYSYEFAYRLPKLSLASVEEIYLPEMVNRFFDISSLQKSISKVLIDLPSAFIQILFSLILLSLYSNVFVIFSIFIVAILGVFLYYTGGRGLSTSLLESDRKYAMGEWLEEIARVFKSFKFSKGSSLPITQTDQISKSYLQARTSHFKVLIFQYWSLIVFKVFVTTGMLLVGSYLLVNNQINIGQFVAAELVILAILGSVEKVIQSLENIYDLLTSLEKLAKITDQPIESGGTLVLENDDKGIEVSMRNVGFSYKDAQVLHQFNIDIKSGNKVCLAGATGAGKTTVLKLLSNSYDDYEGEILMNHVPVGNYAYESLRSRIGVMFSEQDIFIGSLYHNITLGDKTISISDIMTLASKIGLQDFIASLRQGFDTILDPTGRRLPTMIVRKILLLRALVGKPRLLLLEDPFVIFDDAEQKEKFSRFICQDLEKTTVVIASNEPIFQKYADQVVTLSIDLK